MSTLWEITTGAAVAVFATTFDAGPALDSRLQKNDTGEKIASWILNDCVILQGCEAAEQRRAVQQNLVICNQHYRNFKTYFKGYADLFRDNYWNIKK